MVLEQGAFSSKVIEVRLTTSGAPTVQGTPAELAQGVGYISGIAWSTNGQSVLATVKRSNSGTTDATTVVERWTRDGSAWDTFRPAGQPLVYGKDGVFLRYQQGGTATPTPGPTPTPTMTPEQIYYEQFKGIIFWAIYNESNENEQVPISEVLPSVVPAISNTISYDHRYVMARVILANIPFNDAGNGVAYMRRWGASINSADYRLWQLDVNSSCQFDGEPIGTYSNAIAAGASQILRWMRGYAECFRTGESLEGRISNFDTAYQEILLNAIDLALQDHLNGASNPAPSAQYVKHTSACFVWNRNAAQEITSCRGDRGRVDMNLYCNETPNRPADPQTNRNCQLSAINPGSIVLTTEQGTGWLQSAYARQSNQQLGLETIVGVQDQINLGVYTPDQPIPLGNGSYTSDQGCENRCFFLLGNPIDIGELRFPIQETIEASWARHEQRHNDPNYGYRGNAMTYFVHVLRQERRDNQIVAQTWITYAFQQ